MFGPSRDGATSTCDLILDLSGGTRYSRRMNCVRDICAPIRATGPPSNARSPMRAVCRHLRQAALCSLRRGALAIRAPASPAARAVSTCVRPPRSAERQCGRHRRNVCAGCGFVCICMSDRRGVLFAAQRGRADAAGWRTLLQAIARPAAATPSYCSTTVSTARPSSRPGAVRRKDFRRTCCRCASTSDPARTGDHRGGLLPMAAVSCDHNARQAQARYWRASPDGRDVDSIIAALGFGAGLVRISRPTIPTVARHARCSTGWRRGRKSAGFVPRGAKRGVLETTFRELHLAAPAPVDSCRWRRARPFGGVNLNVEGCTLCHACVTACPTGALSDNPDRAIAAIYRKPVRAMRALRIDLSGKGHHP